MGARADKTPREPAAGTGASAGGTSQPEAASGSAAASDPEAKIPRHVAASIRRGDDGPSFGHLVPTSRERAARGRFVLLPAEVRLCKSDIAARKPAGDVGLSSFVVARLLSKSSPPTACADPGALPTFAERSPGTDGFRFSRGSRGLRPVASKWRASSDAPMVDMSTGDSMASSVGTPATAGALPSRFCMRKSLRVAEFHRFLMALSVRPGNILTISDQRVPYRWTASTMARSSAVDHLDLDTSGERWLCQRSRHCLPERPSISLPITDQRTLPWYACIRDRRRASSSGVQTCFFHAPWESASSSSGDESESGDASRLSDDMNFASAYAMWSCLVSMRRADGACGTVCTGIGCATTMMDCAMGG
mmetsp:Transcript_9749/g.31368  ORF Transcript_9749/g.31368 Transcript_9749/m.31368 type:complete len:364 (-) Transcript_9749:78-1169(-)